MSGLHGQELRKSRASGQDTNIFNVRLTFVQAVALRCMLSVMLVLGQVNIGEVILSQAPQGIFAHLLSYVLL